MNKENDPNTNVKKKYIEVKCQVLGSVWKGLFNIRCQNEEMKLYVFIKMVQNYLKQYLYIYAKTCYILKCVVD